MKLKREIYSDYKRNIELGTEGEKVSFQDYYDKYMDTRKIAGTVTKDGLRVEGISTHAIYKMATRNISAREIIDILRNSTHKVDTKHDSTHKVDTKHDSLIYTIDNTSQCNSHEHGLS